ncbi:MAG: glycogen synthase, partial [Deltaproteobacteria bacterium]|nr:glycogen synthase [Deltaproteobacteria bacterium]
RFAFLSKAGLDLSIELGFIPDVVHSHDWQTALASYYIKTWKWDKDYFKGTSSVLTIHNMGYQGQVEPGISPFIGLNWMQLRDSEFEALGAINLLKGGIFYSDKITTVSPNYAREILGEPGGNGLSPFLIRRKDDVIGILNGIDTDEWDPQTDAFLPANYSVSSLKGKADCKKELQKQFLLELNPKKPIFSFVGRMASQKGLDLLLGCVHEILTWDIQLIILGSGDPLLTTVFGDLPKWYPGKVGAYIGFQSYLAHLIEAGSDFFIMPSRYEPCGLNQLYSMLYGTIPIVRATGGLKDTVAKYDPVQKKGLGFTFDETTPMALKDTIGWALYTWYNKPQEILKMKKRGMKEDFSWKKAVLEYEKLYQQAQERKKSW